MFTFFKKTPVMADDFSTIDSRRDAKDTAKETNRIRHTVESSLNKALRRAKRSHGSTYVDVTVSVEPSTLFATFPQEYKKELEKRGFQVIQDNENHNDYHITRAR